MRFLFLIILFFSLQIHAARQDSLSTSKVHSPAYYHLTGKIGGEYPITMDMKIDGDQWTGYCNYSAPFQLTYSSVGDPEYCGSQIKMDENGNLIHNDSIILASGGRFFRGMFDGKKYKGTCYQIDTNNTATNILSFELKEDTSTCIPLWVYLFHDSIIALPGKSYSPTAWFDCSLLFPATAEYPQLSRKLCYIYAGKQSILEVKSKLEHDDKNYLARYKTDIAEQVKNVSKNLSYMTKQQQEDFISTSMPQWETHHSEILFNSKNFLTIRYTNWGSSGMARGMGKDNFYNYSVKEGKLVHLTDVLNLKDSMALKVILVKKLKEFEKVDDNYKMPEDQYILTPDKYYITPKGICLWYFAFGYNFYRVFLPFKELGPIVKKQSWME